MKVLGMLLVLLVSYTSLAQDDNSWESFQQKNYEIQYPTTWELSTEGPIGTDFVILSPLTNAEDGFRENINLLIQDLSNNPVTLDQYVQISINQISTMITDGELLQSERSNAGETPSHQVLWTGKQGIFELKFQQYYFIVDQKAYVLTFTCEEERFDQYRDLGKQMLDSFRLTN